MPKIDFGAGMYMEPGDSKITRWHRQIVNTARIPGTQTGSTIELSCGHVASVFGNVDDLHGTALCLQCRDASEAGSKP